MQLAHNGLDAYAALAHTSAHRVNALLGGGDSYFGAMAGFTCDGTNFNHAVENFRNFVFQQAPQEIAVGAGKDDLRSAAGFFDLCDQSAYTVMNAEAFKGDHFLARHGTFGVQFQADGHTLGIGSLNDAADDLAQLFFIIFNLSSVFSLADFFLNDLAGILSCYAPEVFRCAVNHDQVA